MKTTFYYIRFLVSFVLVGALLIVTLSDIQYLTMGWIPEPRYIQMKVGLVSTFIIWYYIDAIFSFATGERDEKAK